MRVVCLARCVHLERAAWWLRPLSHCLTTIPGTSINAVHTERKPAARACGPQRTDLRVSTQDKTRARASWERREHGHRYIRGTAEHSHSSTARAQARRLPARTSSSRCTSRRSPPASRPHWSSGTQTAGTHQLVTLHTPPLSARLSSTLSSQGNKGKKMPFWREFFYFF